MCGDLPLKNFNGPDHYIDLEDLKLYDLTPETLPLMRYDFAADIAKARVAHPEKFPPIDPDKDADHTRELDGFLPWAITENYEKLKSDFSSLKAFRQYGGTPEEIANAQADCIYVMGVMGHYVGDGSQPLHTTVHFNGWVGDNPKGYTTRQTFHAWIDGGYFKKTGGIKVDALVGKIQPATRIANADQPDGMFKAAVNYLVEQNKFVEPLYELEKNGQLTGEDGKGMDGRAVSRRAARQGRADARQHLADRLARSAGGHLSRTAAPAARQRQRGNEMSGATATRIAAATGFLAVALGAFGAHGLKDILAQNGTAAIWEKAVFYHFIHAVMLFLLAGRKPFAAGAWWCFLAGIVIFSGSLYLLAVTNAHWLGAVTPFGGASFLAGWGWLFWHRKIR